MKLFLSIIPLKEALEVVRKIAPEPDSERVPLIEALGRVLAEDAVSAEDIPSFSRSTVDGYAVVANDTTGAGEAVPAMLSLTGRVSMGDTAPEPVQPGECLYVPTGGILPKGADAMVMVEHTERIADQVLVHRPVAPGENVIFRGEDFAAGSGIVPAGRTMSSRDLGVLAAIGYNTVRVRRRPTIGIISTGNELVPVDTVPGPAQVRDVNTYLCTGFVESRGGIPITYGIVRDERESLEHAISHALDECDAVLVSGGSSKDDRDMCASVLSGLGEVLVHGIAIAPGKPTIIGIARGKPVIGLPGHPASAYVVLTVIVGELVKIMAGIEAPPRTAPAILTEHVPSARGRADYVRVILEDGKATPIFGKSGLLNTLERSSGLVMVPETREGFSAGESVEVLLW